MGASPPMHRIYGVSCPPPPEGTEGGVGEVRIGRAEGEGGGGARGGEGPMGAACGGRGLKGRAAVSGSAHCAPQAPQGKGNSL